MNEIEIESRAVQSMDSATGEPPVVVLVVDDSTEANGAVQLTAVHNGDPTTTNSRLQRIATARYCRPDLDFLEDTEEGMRTFFTECVPLYKHALDGNWQAAKPILDENPRLKRAAIAGGWPTVLHVAASTNHHPFVVELLKLLDNDEIALQDQKSNTAFCFVAAAGNWRIAELMLTRNPNLPTIPGGEGMYPVQFAALQGRCPMACKLYPMTKHMFKNDDADKNQNLLFFTCIKTCNYRLALKMVRDNKMLAFARDEDPEYNGFTALHLLAQNEKPLDSCCHCSEPPMLIRINPAMKQHVFFQLVNCLWKTIISNTDSKRKIIDIISRPSQLLFDAAQVGNFGFLSELISAYPSLIWEVDSKNRSIIHTAVLHRHASIYNLIHEIGFVKDIIVTYEGNEDKNLLLHLAAKLAPPSQLELVSGAAFQMSLEISWFEEVKHIIPLSFIRMKNSEGLTAQELFTREHKELLREAEAWMKRTAESCMLISTVIATGVFSAAISVPGGMDDETKKPNYLNKASFLVFAISDAMALISSATAILIFLSILISRYAEYDFHRSLPLKLIFGLFTLFISITSMMVAFGSAFFITYNYGFKWIPSSISVLACLPILIFIVLKFSLWFDIIKATCYRRTLFKPRKKMLYVDGNVATTFG
ncbi:uncharacterized protein LOC113853184 [Abrus precatorius]|uniref:Uncharacterized protein LOC113853184 n=1 Tax=Abrus precatorius TaxID=3816 RepID=A0A8B8K8L4_ABRPR|nr:uncharacterized protein LOC113853184 [Abrus precatorius]